MKISFIAIFFCLSTYCGCLCLNTRPLGALCRHFQLQPALNLKPSLALHLRRGESEEVTYPAVSSRQSNDTVELNDELKRSFMSYAMSTILGRALPDVRDGLKPVHRRVLYAMSVLGLTPDAGYRKCARIVGEVLGKFHPHGDQSVYDALVRMAQDFVMMHPLIMGHGNFGSVDDDPPAAMRYTEAKLSRLAQDALLGVELKEHTVDYVPNFDGNEEEPLILPAKIPLLLVNGATGIAVGMATNVPPHNLKEVLDAMVALIDNPDLSDEDLFQIIPAPDFPTGGVIVGLQGVRDLYRTGRGSLILRGRTHVEVLGASSTKTSTNKGRNAIVITEVPYLTNKAALLEKIADLVNEKKLEGIADLRDESDRDGVRIVVELKRDAVPAIVTNNLFQTTSLQTTFSGNFLALVDEGRQPQRLSLREIITHFIQFRFHTIRRRTSYQLRKLQERQHIVQGLLRALKHVDAIIAVLKTSVDASAARSALRGPPFDFSSEQAEAVLSITLRRLTGLEERKLVEEEETLRKDIDGLQELLGRDDLIYSTIKKETLALKTTHGIARKSEIIVQDEQGLTMEDLLSNERSVILITHSGYIKRMPLEGFEAQLRGGKGKVGAKFSTDADSVAHFFTCMDHDSVLFITERGVAYSVKAYEIPKASRHAKGVPLPQVLPVASAMATVTSVIPVDAKSFGEDDFLVLLTAQGFVKKTPLKAFESVTARGLTMISLGENDSLRWARKCKPQEDVLMATSSGFANRFCVEDLRSTGRTSRGCRAMKLRKGDTMVGMDVLDKDLIKEMGTGEHPASRFVLVITEKGYGKRVPIEEFSRKSRGLMGIIAIKFKSKAEGGDRLCGLRVCGSGEEVVFSTTKGAMTRQRIDDISIQSRTATGVKIQNTDKDDIITMIDIVPESL